MKWALTQTILFKQISSILSLNAACSWINAQFEISSCCFHQQQLMNAFNICPVLFKEFCIYAYTSNMDCPTGAAEQQAVFFELNKFHTRFCCHVSEWYQLIVWFAAIHQAGVFCWAQIYQVHIGGLARQKQIGPLVELGLSCQSNDKTGK